MDRVKWWEPYAATRREAARELRDLGMLSIRWWIRPLSVVVAVMTVAIIASFWAFPGFQIPWTPLLLAMLVMPLFLSAGALLSAFMPRQIDVRRDRIHIAKGNSSYLIRPSELLDVMIADVDESPRLLVRYRRTGKAERSRSFAIGKNVDTEALAMLLVHLRDSSTYHERTS